jgi:hypothetical protein
LPDSDDTVPDFGQPGRNLAGAAGSPAIWPGYWLDSAVLVESPANPVGIFLEWQDPGQLAGIRHKWPNSGHVCRKLYEKYFYIFFY